MKLTTTTKRRARKTGAFPHGFIWGAATAGHQIEGNNTNSDIWFLEHARHTAYSEPSLDACDSFNRWPEDLDIVKTLGLNAYRFSLEWARIEPDPGVFSRAMLNHYKKMIDGCQARGLTPIVTFNHFSAPRWFAARGGWESDGAPALFARFCDRAARHCAAGMGYAVTLNEPNLMRLLKWIPLPQAVWDADELMLANAARALGVKQFSVANSGQLGAGRLKHMIAGHKVAYAAIKAVRPDLPVGVALAISDDQAVGRNSRRDEKRRDVYEDWLEAAKTGDFIGVQNYARQRLDKNGPMPPPGDAELNHFGDEIYPASLEGAIRYCHAATGLPVLVTENGIGTPDDSVRARYIARALDGVRCAISDGVPVLGYCHWSLLDNFEWVFGYKPQFGLVAVNRRTFKRTIKRSAYAYGEIARSNGA